MKTEQDYWKVGGTTPRENIYVNESSFPVTPPNLNIAANTKLRYHARLACGPVVSKLARNRAFIDESVTLQVTNELIIM